MTRGQPEYAARSARSGGHPVARSSTARPTLLPTPRSAWHNDESSTSLRPTCMNSSATLEELNRAFVLDRRRARRKRAEVSALAGFRILLPRIQPVTSVGQLADHRASHSLRGARRRTPRPRRTPRSEQQPSRFFSAHSANSAFIFRDVFIASSLRRLRTPERQQQNDKPDRADHDHRHAPAHGHCPHARTLDFRRRRDQRGTGG